MRPGEDTGRHRQSVYLLLTTQLQLWREQGSSGDSEAGGEWSTLLRSRERLGKDSGSK